MIGSALIAHVIRRVGLMALLVIVAVAVIVVAVPTTIAMWGDGRATDPNPIVVGVVFVVSSGAAAAVLWGLLWLFCRGTR